MKRTEIRAGIWSLWVALLLACALSAQQDSPLGLPGIDPLPGAAFGGPEESQVTVSGEFKMVDGTRGGRLFVRAEVSPGWHVYSLTQKPGGPTRSSIKIESPEIQLTRPFVADRLPFTKRTQFFPVPSEEYAGEVVWSAPFKLAEGVDPTQLTIHARYDGLVCQDSGVCIPVSQVAVAAKFAGPIEASPASDFAPARSHVRLRGEIAPRTATPGGKVRLTLTAEPAAKFHVYAHADRDPNKVSKPTLIAWKQLHGWTATKPIASEKPTEHASGDASEPIQYFHEKSVSWTVDVTIPEDAAPGGYELRGLLGIQTCTKQNCDPPAGAEFRVVVDVVKTGGDAAPEWLSFTASTYAAAAKLAEEAANTPVASSQETSDDRSTGKAAAEPANEPSPTTEYAGPELEIQKLTPVGGIDQKQSIASVLPIAFLAGFILNFMPCVLPVIGLKIVSFVQQAGQSRGRIFLLNLWYSLGLLAVFMVLATMAVVFNFGWGEQFQSATFNIVLASIVFAFALSFLGVWEIPLPGFVGSVGDGQPKEQEGAAGAFLKGVLTTVLATPCSGPLLVPAIAWAVKQPPLVAYVAFACVGLGMAFPYLLVGAFPKLISFLPKPGAWMETFKHMMGFVLLGTVVFILTYVRMPLVVPTVAFMIGMWAALWWVGRVPIWDELHKRIRAWAGGATFATMIALLTFTPVLRQVLERVPFLRSVAAAASLEPASFSSLAEIMEARFERDIDGVLTTRSLDPNKFAAARHPTDSSELDWKPYSLALLSKAVLSEKKVVFVDFTADW